jgi:hypothetical protein
MYTNKYINAYMCIYLGLDVVVESGDRESMMEVMKNIRDVRKRTPQISSMFDPLRTIVFLLKVLTTKSICIYLHVRILFEVFLYLIITMIVSFWGMF